jgi:hypothetical protein
VPINPESDNLNPLTGKGESSSSSAAFGQGKGKKSKQQKKAEAAAAEEHDIKVKSNPGWGYKLKPLKRQTVSDAVLGMPLFSLCSRVAGDDWKSRRRGIGS